MKPAGKLKLWTGGYVNRPGVNPPGYLRFIIALCALSLACFFFYAALVTLGHLGGPDRSPVQTIVEAFIYFILPFTVLYTISTNNPASRFLILAYFGLTSVAIAKYQPALLSTLESPALIVYVLFMAVTVLWLFVSPRARAYYALIGGSPVPKDLEHIADKLVSPGATQLWFRRLGEKIEPFSPLIIIAIAIILVVVGWRNLTPY